ncbi:FMN-binding protein [Psychrilyobacter atlanticus]|uniref:FMN-binding protein n=1 Tax=Psychrilyobacter atlanticus TaxID=271091 RepID=UPI0004185B51|nr:FMN-binding protein [Psychrilyobacter atlanticus]
MKKIILYLIMATSILGAQLMDGEYFVQQDEYPHGWASTAGIRVEDGKIVEVTTDKVNKAGKLVSQDVKYNEKMRAKSGTDPKEYSVVLTENFMEGLEKKSIGKDDFQMPEIDIVAGATSSSKKFKKMMEFLVEKAESGKTGDHRMKL